MKKNRWVACLAMLAVLALAQMINVPKALAANGYGQCQCTWWAQEKRQDLPGGMGDALNWGASARAAGFQTGSTPAVGAIVVFQPDVQGADSTSGHVAYVEQVYNSSSFRISEMGWGTDKCSVHRRDASTGPGVEFIYSRGGGCTPDTNQISLFVDVKHGGQCVTKDVGTYSNPGAIGLPNDSISSIKVGSKVKGVLCRDDDYGGGCYTFSGNDSDLTNNRIGNDQVSSVRVEPRSSKSSSGGGCKVSSYQVALFVDTSYSGQCVIRDVGSYSNPGAIGLPNDSISSIKVGSRVKAVLCRDDDYGGGCYTYSGSDSNLSNNSIGSDQVSSVRVEPRSSGKLSGYKFCANEGQRCSFSGTKDVAYGADGKFNYKHKVTGGIDCNNDTFGDPAYGVTKACYIR